jgi:ribonuclease HII
LINRAVLKKYFLKKGWEAGCDEAGRGCLAGPVFAAAVILPKDFYHPLLNDSKQTTEESRNLLRIEIEEKAICYAVASMTPAQIDRYNILRASITSMQKALDNLSVVPDRILVDGNKFYEYKGIEYHTIIKGDGIYASIAAASILAKTYRDEYMMKMDKKYPGYGFANNKGYPTQEHRDAIVKLGITKIHRRSFRLLPDAEQLSLFD